MLEGGGGEEAGARNPKGQILYINHHLHER